MCVHAHECVSSPKLIKRSKTRYSLGLAMVITLSYKSFIASYVTHLKAAPRAKCQRSAHCLIKTQTELFKIEKEVKVATTGGATPLTGIPGTSQVHLRPSSILHSLPNLRSES